MTDDSPPQRVFKIGELARLIASKVIRKRRARAVNLACVCRCLEEPVLSVLWETQSSLHTLLETLPEGTWDWDELAQGESVVCGLDLPSEESIA